jgi:hypothetical protein
VPIGALWADCGRGLRNARKVGWLTALTLIVEGLYFRFYLALKELNRTFPPAVRAIYDAKANMGFAIVALAIPIVMLLSVWFACVLQGLLDSRRRSGDTHE